MSAFKQQISAPESNNDVTVLLIELSELFEIFTLAYFNGDNSEIALDTVYTAWSDSAAVTSLDR